MNIQIVESDKIDENANIHEAIEKRNRSIGWHILAIAGASAYVALSIFFLALLIAMLVELIKNGEPTSPFEGRSMNRMGELSSNWLVKLRESNLGLSEAMSLAAINTALVLAVSLRSRNAQDGTVDEEARFTWLRRVAMMFCFFGATLSWGLAIVQDWQQPEGFSTGLATCFLAITGCGLAAVVGDSIYSLNRTKRQIYLREAYLMESRDYMTGRAAKSIRSSRFFTFIWCLLGALLPVGITVSTATWSLRGREGNAGAAVAPALFAVFWCTYVWYYQSRMVDLTQGRRRYVTLHIFAGCLLLSQGFGTHSLVTGDPLMSAVVVTVTGALPWLAVRVVDKFHPIFMIERLNTIDKEFDRIDEEMLKLDQRIDAVVSRGNVLSRN